MLAVSGLLMYPTCGFAGAELQPDLKARFLYVADCAQHSFFNCSLPPWNELSFLDECAAGVVRSQATAWHCGKLTRFKMSVMLDLTGAMCPMRWR